jgi:hypothetical protein
MQAGNRRRWDRAKTEKAITALVELGWTRSVTEHGLTLTAPTDYGPRKGSEQVERISFDA